MADNVMELIKSEEFQAVARVAVIVILIGIAWYVGRISAFLEMQSCQQFLPNFSIVAQIP